MIKNPDLMYQVLPELDLMSPEHPSFDAGMYQVLPELDLMSPEHPCSGLGGV